MRSKAFLLLLSLFSIGFVAQVTAHGSSPLPAVTQNDADPSGPRSPSTQSSDSGLLSGPPSDLEEAQTQNSGTPVNTDLNPSAPFFTHDDDDPLANALSPSDDLPCTETYENQPQLLGSTEEELDNPDEGEPTTLGTHAATASQPSDNDITAADTVYSSPFDQPEGSPPPSKRGRLDSSQRDINSEQCEHGGHDSDAGTSPGLAYPPLPASLNTHDQAAATAPILQMPQTSEGNVPFSFPHDGLGPPVPYPNMINGADNPGYAGNGGGYSGHLIPAPVDSYGYPTNPYGYPTNPQSYPQNNPNLPCINQPAAQSGQPNKCIIKLSGITIGELTASVNGNTISYTVNLQQQTQTTIPAHPNPGELSSVAQNLYQTFYSLFQLVQQWGAFHLQVNVITGSTGSIESISASLNTNSGNFVFYEYQCSKYNDTIRNPQLARKSFLCQHLHRSIAYKSFDHCITANQLKQSPGIRANTEQRSILPYFIRRH